MARVVIDAGGRRVEMDDANTNAETLRGLALDAWEKVNPGDEPDRPLAAGFALPDAGRRWTTPAKPSSMWRHPEVLTEVWE